MELGLKLDRPLVVFDIESTGVNSRLDRIIELAAIRIEPDGTETERCWLLNPEVRIPPETTAIHGITDEMVRDCPTFRDAAADIELFFRDCDLSGFNCDRFDVPCLEEEFARVGLNFDASGRRHVDVQRIYHKKEPRDLSAAVQFYCGRDHAGAHGADGDYGQFGLESAVLGTDESEIGTVGQNPGSFVHQIVVVGIGVSEHHLIDIEFGNEFVELVLRVNGNAFWIEILAG